MTVNKISSIDPLVAGKKSNQDNRIGSFEKTDSIVVSSEAMEKGELYRGIELVSAAPDTRVDRIADLKKKINDPSYINEAIINAIADKIIDAFGL
ncbi:MAG: flagellar biosynthesis anti-sigma factor FlgM [Treponema sp.]|jgi:negative regulator of flagellin synthesis FlgM|nr:flagellar biosynthesis anti-sigma factor FlgM [Treponema sp.]